MNNLSSPSDWPSALIPHIIHMIWFISNDCNKSNIILTIENISRSNLRFCSSSRLNKFKNVLNGRHAQLENVREVWGFPSSRRPEEGWGCSLISILGRPISSSTICENLHKSAVKFAVIQRLLLILHFFRVTSLVYHPSVLRNHLFFQIKVIFSRFKVPCQ